MKRVALSVLLAAVCAAAHAGVVYEIEVMDHGQSEPEATTTEVSVEGQNLKMTVSAGRSGQPGAAIFRGGDGGEMVIVDDSSKSYTVMDRQALESIVGQVSGAMQQMQKMLENLPKEQQEAIRRAQEQGVNIPGMGKPPAKRASSTLRRTGETGTRAGYPCVKYVVERDGRTVRELWVTDWSNIEGGSEATSAFEGMAEYFQEMRAALEEAAGGMPGYFDGMDDNPFEHMSEIDGFPVVTREFGDGGELEDESILRSASRRTLDPSDFEPPSGYKRRSMLGAE